LYPLQEVAKELIEDLKFGFKLKYTGTRLLAYTHSTNFPDLFDNKNCKTHGTFVCEFTTPSELAPLFVEAPTGTCTKHFLEINSFPFLEIWFLLQHKQNPITNIHIWTSAFMIFMGVMLEKWPIKGQELLKYMHNVSWLPREYLV
jgi:hypothetical protein